MLSRHLILVLFVELTKSRVQAIMYVLSENADLSGRSSSLGSLIIYFLYTGSHMPVSHNDVCKV